MSKRKLSEKYNDSCVKIFDLIKLFTRGEVEFSEVIKLFADEDGSLSQKSNVILNKYMNTLDIFGIKVSKSKNKYYLQKMPFTISLNEDELGVVALIKSAINYLPAGKNKASLEEFIGDLENRYDRQTKKLNLLVKNSRNVDLSFYFLKFKNKISDCEKFCEEGYKVDLCYVNEDNETVNMICLPIDVKYYNDMAYFSVYNFLTKQNFDIPVNSIMYVKSINVKSKEDKVCTTVIFKLKGDLAKRYRLREWEQVDNVSDDGVITVVNSGEDFNALATRLFKYDKDCTVISPKYLKNKVRKLINDTLKNYG